MSCRKNEFFGELGFGVYRVMGRRGLLVLFLVIQIVGHSSVYSFRGNFRVLSSEGGQEPVPGKNGSGSPSPSPLPALKKDVGSKNGAVEGDQGGGHDSPIKKDDVQKPGAEGKDEKGSNKGESPLGPSHDSPVKTDDAKKGGAEGKDGNGGDKVEASSDHSQGGDQQAKLNCGSSAYSTCTDHHGMVACLGIYEPGKVYIMVKNEGEKLLNVTIKVPTLPKIPLKVEKSHHEKANISIMNSFNPRIVLNAGYEDCSLQPGMLFSASYFLQNLPRTVTPVYGAYGLLLITVVAGGVWACCKFRKKTRRGGDGVPYHELEMGIPQPSTAIDEEGVGGWDHGWDDDWDDKPDRQVRSISENGLSSRSAKKDKWEKDWND